MVTVIHVETSRSWKRTLRSPTKDYGLAQIHVSVTTNPGLLGREEVLFDPATNIRYMGRTMLMWKNWHCRSNDGHHHWINHYKWGYLVKDTKWANKVMSLFKILHKRFRKEESKKLLVHLES